MATEDQLALKRAQAAGAGDLPAEVIARLKAENPGVDLLLLNAGPYTGVFKSPPYAEWQRFKSMFWDKAHQSKALETLCFGCLVYPEPDAFRAMLQKKPGIADQWGARLVAMGGPEQEVVEKKL
jgi:hypothetical protein